MKTASKTVYTFSCEICGTGFSSKVKAEQCEKLPIEKARYELAQKVSSLESRVDVSDKKFRLSGYVVKILIEPPDEEYLNKWLHDRSRLVIHNLIYLVNENPRAVDGHRYYATEIEPTKLSAGKHFLKHTNLTTV